MKSEDQDMKRLEEACQVLSEHFDSVQIFVTRCEMGVEDGTVNANFGTGNWFARFGQVQNWMLKAQERIKLEVRSE